MKHSVHCPSDLHRIALKPILEIFGKSSEAAIDPTPAGELRNHVRASAENRPGIYRMLGPGGVLLYVGKSLRVRGRLLSYFRCKPGEKGEELIRHTHAIEWTYMPSEFAATLEEMRTIQRFRPPFNVEHKRDRAFCFVKITREAAPRLLVVRSVQDDAARYYGPFRGAPRVRAVMKDVTDLLSLRDCARGTPMRFADQTELFAVQRQPLCVRPELDRCLAPCASGCTSAEYRERVQLAAEFLDGDTDGPLRVLDGRMRAAAARLQFEYAAELRDRSRRLAEARHELVSLRGLIDSLTFLYAVPGHDGDDRLYVIRRGRVHEEHRMPVTGTEWSALRERAARLFRRSGPGALRPIEAAEVLLLARWFRRKPEELARTFAPDEPVPAGPIPAMSAANA